MSIVERATKRLEELQRAGVSVPWAAAGISESDMLVHPKADHRRSAEVVADIALTAASVPVRQFERDFAAPPVRPLPKPILASVQGKAPIEVTLNLEQLERSGRVVSTKGRSVVAEEFRRIKRPLLKNARHKDARQTRSGLIMVTSALPREGKTFCAINLALSMATEIDTSVLLIDADVVRPEVLNRLGILPKKGLLDLLTQPELDLSDLVLQTNVPKLSILSAGTSNTLSTELLASEAMERFLESLMTRYPEQIVIFDGPPLLVTNEASVLASRVGQVIMVIESEGTPRTTVEQAFAVLESCPLVMSVLNKAPVAEAALAYGYYYG